MPELTPEEFSALLLDLRPTLLQTARQRFGSPSDTDAEDLLSETVLTALHILPRFEADTSLPANGLLSWLQGIMRYAAGRERRRSARQVSSVPLESARHVASPPDPSPDPIQGKLGSLHCLPRGQQALVRAWLYGYSQRQIAREFHLHYNTVGNRLELAFEQLGLTLPDRDAISYSFSLINYCSRVTVYHKPTGVWRSWFAKTPADIRFRVYTRAPQEPRVERWPRVTNRLSS